MTNLAPNSPVMSPAGLSPRELEVLRLICDGVPTKVAAHMLNVSVYTIEAHRYAINKKTGTHAGPELGVWAVRNGIVPMVPA